MDNLNVFGIDEARGVKFGTIVIAATTVAYAVKLWLPWLKFTQSSLRSALPILGALPILPILFTNPGLVA